MTKAELVSAVALKTGFAKSDISVIVEATISSIQETIVGGEDVFLRGFGSFVTKTRKQKVARNILKEQSIIVPEHKVPAFKPSKDFIQKLK